MKIIFSKLAKQELDDATHYYEIQYTGLGKEFRKEVHIAAKRISKYPEAWSISGGDVRKCLLHKFPYKLLYSIESGHIFIIAVAHQHRRPDYWIGRSET